MFNLSATSIGGLVVLSSGFGLTQGTSIDSWSRGRLVSLLGSSVGNSGRGRFLSLLAGGSVESWGGGRLVGLLRSSIVDVQLLGKSLPALLGETVGQGKEGCGRKTYIFRAPT